MPALQAEGDTSLIIAAASFPSTGSGSIGAGASPPEFRQLRGMGFFSLNFNPTNQPTFNEVHMNSRKQAVYWIQ
jgi:hypothetical protein